MTLQIHRKEQWDLECSPFVCVHAHRTNSSTRVFCLWRDGIQIGGWYWQWNKGARK